MGQPINAGAIEMKLKYLLSMTGLVVAVAVLPWDRVDAQTRPGRHAQKRSQHVAKKPVATREFISEDGGEELRSPGTRAGRAAPSARTLSRGLRSTTTQFPTLSKPVDGKLERASK